MQSELTVTSAFYAQLFYDVESSFSEHGEFCWRKGNCWSNYDGVTGVYTNWVNVFHRANGDDVRPWSHG